jgi:riboflavin kinase / FMN adenylyltransferase
MKLLRGLKPFGALKSGVVATIGNFDGVHLGHQALLNTLIQRSTTAKLPSMVILFEPQPGEFFDKQNAPARLSYLRDKLAQFESLGIDYVYCLSFNQQLASMGPDEFIQTFLCSILNVQHLLIGQDFRFGKNRLGNVSLLHQFLEAQSRSLEIFSDFKVGGDRVSSTNIRLALKDGNMQFAKACLGRDYALCRRVVKGDGRGREWGIPTANFAMPKSNLPLKGVFCVNAVKSDKSVFQGVANIGSRPTVDGSKNILEVHLLDVNESLYGDLLQIEFLHKLRDEVRFNSIDDLIEQIKSDIESARSYFRVNSQQADYRKQMNKDEIQQHTL